MERTKMDETAGAVRVVSRRVVQPSGSCPGATPSEDIHLPPWDLSLLTIEYGQKGVLLPAPPVGGERLVQALASSLSRALARFYHFAGRLAVDEKRRDETVTVRLRCTGEGAELVHAAAPGVAVKDVVGSVYSPLELLRDFFPLNGVRNAEAAIESLPVLSAQLTELSDGVFVAVSLNHSVGDCTSLWEFFNAWSQIHRSSGCGDNGVVTAPVHGRWFLTTCPVPVPLPFVKLQHILRRYEPPPAREAFFTFSAASVKKLKATANDEMAGIATAPISSMQALLAHFWRAVCRARRLKPGQETFYSIVVGGRGRVSDISPGYVGNALLPTRVFCAVGDILDKGLGWTAWQLNRAVTSIDEAAMREYLEGWVREPTFTYTGKPWNGGVGIETGGSSRFDVYGNDFGWGRPVGMRTGPGCKMEGEAMVFEGPDRGGSMSLDVCLAPDALERLIADDEFMDAVTLPVA